jgi:hypothetical protein
MEAMIFRMKVENFRMVTMTKMINKWITFKMMMRMMKWIMMTQMKMRKNPFLNHLKRDLSHWLWKYQTKIITLLLNPEKYPIYPRKTKLWKPPLKIINKILKILKIIDF